MSRFTRAVRIAVVVGLCMAVIAPAAPAAVANTTAVASAPGEIVVVTINAYQRTMDEKRLNTLADGLTTRVGGVAPDIILIQEIVSEPLAYLRDALNRRSNPADAKYEVAGRVYSESFHIKVKALLNTATMTYKGYTLWKDACSDKRAYQIIHAEEKATVKPVVAAGVHIAPMSNPAGTDECKIKNANKTREVMAPYDETGSIVGDFNRRAMDWEYECDPNEDLSDPMQWYIDVTEKKDNGYWYQDTVRKHHWGLGLGTLKDQWTFEFPEPESLCTVDANGVYSGSGGDWGHRRMRMDYVFTSSSMGVIEAHADKGWGNTATTGDMNCDPAPECKYSDHRFVWSRLTLPGTTPTEPEPDPAPNTAPTVTIDSPADSASFAHGQEIIFSGTASDAEESNLSGKITWSSNNETLHTGATFTRTLSEGTHTVTATVTDSGGLSASDSVTVTVDPPPISLSATGRKVKGKKTVDLNWSPAPASVDVFRDGNKVATTTNDGTYTDTITTKGGGTYTYKVCETGTTTCSNGASVSF